MKKIDETNRYQFTYLSVAAFSFSQKELADLLAQSRKFNTENEITGLLLYVDGHFMQLLEGSRGTIEDLMSRIKKDARHHHVDIMEEGPLDHRQFPDWSMAFLDFASPQVRSLPGYSNFLDAPPEVADLAGNPECSGKLLHYFKAIMLASNSSILRLAEEMGP